MLSELQRENLCFTLFLISEIKSANTLRLAKIIFLKLF